MIASEIIIKTENWVKLLLASDASGHDWFHIERVRNTANVIAQNEKANLFIVEIAALLHDVTDWKLTSNEILAKSNVNAFLLEMDLSNHQINMILEIIESVSFKGAGITTLPKTIEGMIVQDADRLDAIGAIGIARAFAYGGNKQRPMWEPGINAIQHKTFEDYKNNKGNTINHFYEKLLLLKDRMNTQSAKLMAEIRHKRMEVFLDNFYSEWEGKS